MQVLADCQQVEVGVTACVSRMSLKCESTAKGRRWASMEVHSPQEHGPLGESTLTAGPSPWIPIRDP